MEKVLDGNLQLSVSKSIHMLDLYSAPTHIEWVSIDTSTYGLTAILITQWQDTHLLMAELISLVRHNSWERRAHVDWAAEDAFLPIHYLRRLSLYVNTWFISVAEKVRDIDLYTITAIIFYLYRHNFDAPHMPAMFVCTPPELALTQPSIHTSSSLDPATLQHQAAHTGRVCW